MKEAIEKMLENFVFDGIDIEYYLIEDYITPEEKVKQYEVKIFVSPSIDMVDAETLRSRLESGLTMLGFNSIIDAIVYLEDIDKILIRTAGKVRLNN